MMHGLHMFLLFSVLTYAEHEVFGTMIINGKDASENFAVYMASVQNEKHEHKCGGFLISEDFVITAAHCSKSVSVVLGTSNLKKIDESMRYKVKKYQHPLYENVRNGSDIMLLKLSRKAQLSKKVKPIQLPKTVMKMKDKQICHVVGWGRTQTGNLSDVLKVAKVPIINSHTCQKEWEHVKVQLPHDIVCAGGYKTDKGFCGGDSGGPLVCDNKAVGIVSFNMGGNCNYPNIPNVYTDLSKFLPWIKESIKKRDC